MNKNKPFLFFPSSTRALTTLDVRCLNRVHGGLSKLLANIFGDLSHMYIFETSVSGRVAHLVLTEVDTCEYMDMSVYVKEEVPLMFNMQPRYSSFEMVPNHALDLV